LLSIYKPIVLLSPIINNLNLALEIETYNNFSSIDELSKIHKKIIFVSSPLNLFAVSTKTLFFGENSLKAHNL